MTLRQYLLTLTFGTVAAIAAATIVVVAIDPVTAGGLAFLALYITMGAACVGLLTTVGTLWRIGRNTSEDVSIAVAQSLRQGIFLSLLVLTALFMSAHGYLGLWTVLLLVVLITLVEFFFLATKKS